MNININLADYEMIIANSVQIMVFKSLSDLEWYGSGDDEGLLTNMIGYDAYLAMITAFENKKTVIVAKGQYRYAYDGSLCTIVLDYEII